MIRKIQDRELHEECGVFGVFGVPNAASLTYYGLHALQHRGQEGAGIVAVDAEKNFRRIKGAGLVTEVFDESKLSTLRGDMAIRHRAAAVRRTSSPSCSATIRATSPWRTTAISSTRSCCAITSRTGAASSSRPPTAKSWPTSSRRRPATTTVRASSRLSMR